MRRLFVPALVGLSGRAASAAVAQTTLLNQLEQRLGNAAPGGQAAAPAAPGGYLGAKFDNQTDPVHGVHVNLVRSGTPAASGGLKVGDYIAAIDGKPTLNWDQFDAILDNTKPGQKVELTIERNGQKQQLTVTLGNPPPPTASAEPGASTAPATPSLGAATATPGTSSPPATSSPSLFPSTLPSTSPSGSASAAPSATDNATRPGISAQPLNLGPPPPETPSTPALGGFGSTPSFGGGNASLGITVIPLTDDKKAELGFTVNRGALVSLVKPGSAAQAAGLPENSLIVRMNNRPINSADDLVAAIRTAQPGQEVELQYYVGTKLETKMVRLGAAAPASPTTPISPSLGGVEPPGATIPGTGTNPSGESPLRLGGAPPGGGLLNRVERPPGSMPRAGSGSGAAGGAASMYGSTTVYNPQQMADVLKAVADLQQRLKAIEAKIGISSQDTAPGLGSPSGTGTNP